MKQVSGKSEWIALACGVLGVLAAVWVYWMILPGVIFGAVAVVLGWRARRNGGSERGSAALALGIVAILLVPSVLLVADNAEKWGRDCVSDPNPDPNC
jgi:hypothetical protein